MKSLGINWLAKQNQTMPIVLRFENQILILKFFWRGSSNKNNKNSK